MMNLGSTARRSVIYVAGLLCLVQLTLGLVQAPLSVQRIAICPSGTVRIAGIPNPRDMLVIREGAPLVVPPGKLLAITGLGTTNSGGAVTIDVTLRVDGQDEFAASIRLPYGNGTTIAEPPLGFTAAAGSTVEVVGSFGCAWGYTADVVPPHDIIRVEGIPDLRSMIVIHEGVPFTVPPGKTFATTGLGGAATGVQSTLQVDGLNQLVAISNWSLGTTSSVVAVPSGLAVRSGSTAAVISGTAGLGRAWGYLVDE